MSIDVHVRVRPGVENSVWATAETVIHNTVNQKTRFVFSKVHPTTSSNTSLFRGVEPLVHAAFEGRHVTIMAYGQTGSGKTHSMLGVPTDLGIVPRAAKLLLELIASHPSQNVSVGLSIMEIYNDQVRDLLDPNCRELFVKDGVPPDHVVSTDARTVPISTLESFTQLSTQALGNRKTGVTNMNEHSSRSHMILSLEVRRGGRCSSISLVDLAGSESASRANTKGMQLQEGGHINQSLLSLGNVVNAIIEGRSHVPYRESKLTRLLRHCLGGTGLTCILCCVNPAKDNQEQTSASLHFAQRAMKIKSDPVMVVNTPPLFAHQFIESAAMGLGTDIPELCRAAFQRGLCDAYHGALDTTGTILSSNGSHMRAALHAITNTQRLLLVHDQACGAEELDRLDAQLTRANDAVAAFSNECSAEGKRVREQDMALESRRSKVSRLEQELDERTRAADCDVAHWEYQLYEAKKHQILDTDVLIAEERATRWMVMRDYWNQGVTIQSNMVQLIRDLMALESDEKARRVADDEEATSLGSIVIAATGDGGEEAAAGACMAGGATITPRQRRLVHAMCAIPSGASLDVRVQLMEATNARLERDVADLESAFEMVRDELPTANENEATAHLSNEELMGKIRKLEEEEVSLKATLAASSKQASIRRVRDTITSSSSMSAVRNESPPQRHVTPPTRLYTDTTPSSTANTTPTHQSSHSVAAGPRPSVLGQSYVSPYSQRAIAGGYRSPATPKGHRRPAGGAASSPTARPATGGTSCAAAERASKMGYEVRSAVNLLRETREKLLLRSPPVVGQEDINNAVVVRASASSPLLARSRNHANIAAPTTTTATSGGSMAAKPPMSPPPPVVQTEEVLGIAARRRLENVPQRPAAEGAMYLLSLSPQLDLRLNPGKSVPSKRGGTRSRT